MAKAKLELGVELDLLNKDELSDALSKHDSWQRDAAFGVRHQDLPRMYGTPDGGDLALGYDQPDGQWCGPRAGWFWAVHRISVDGLASGDEVKIYNQSKFIGWVSYQPGFITFGKGVCSLKDGDYLRVVGTGLTTTGQIEVFGEGISVPAPLQWKVFS